MEVLLCLWVELMLRSRTIDSRSDFLLASTGVGAGRTEAFDCFNGAADYTCRSDWLIYCNLLVVFGSCRGLTSWTADSSNLCLS